MSNKTPNSETRQNARRHTTQLKQMLQSTVSTKKTEIVTSNEQPIQRIPYPAQKANTLEGVQENLTIRPAKPPIRRTLRSTEEHMQRSKSHVAKLILQTKQLSELNHIFHAYLPAYLHAHASLAKLDSEGWVVQTDSPVWATRLRYILPSLQKPLSEKLNFQVPAPRIRVAPPAIPLPPPPRARRMTITHNTAKVLEGAARNLTDRRLGAVMARLAAHAKQRSQES
jgi:hypothetical protein